MFRIIVLSAVVITTACLFVHVANAQDLDVQIQSEGGQLVIGIGEVSPAEISLSVNLGQRVFTQTLDNLFLNSNPGFNIEPTGSPLLPAGVEGLGVGTNVFFDFVPTTIDGVTSNFFFWDGTDSNGDGQLTIDDVDIGLPLAGSQYGILAEDGFVGADASENLIEGGLIGPTSFGGEAGGLGVGRLHNHLILGVDEGDGLTSTPGPEGLYIAGLQIRAEGFETSDPFFFVHRSTQISEEASDLVATFLDDNFEEIVGISDDLPGDFNSDGLVNAADFTVLRDGGAAVDSFSDGFNDFAANFGAGSTVASAASAGSQAAALVATTAIPEPGALVLTFASLAACFFRRRYRPVL